MEKEIKKMNDLIKERKELIRGLNQLIKEAKGNPADIVVFP